MPKEGTPQRLLNPYSPGTSPTIPQEVDQQEPPSPDENRNLQYLRTLAQKGENVDVEAMEAEVSALRQQVAIARTGIDAESPLGKLFLRGYEGDLNDVDAVKATARELGIPFRWEER
jgi:hypothetical protein